MIAKVGEKHGRLSVLSIFDFITPSGNKQKKCRCSCECGNDTVIYLSSLTSSRPTKSCGCLTGESAAKRLTKHGQAKTKLWSLWCSMRNRCRNPKKKDYKYYGGKGVKVCSDWLDYTAFEEWAISSGYQDGLEIDRINNDGDYEPSNCHWVTRIENMRNTSFNRNIEAYGETRCLNAWAADDRCSVTRKAVAWRLDQGWQPEEAISLPSGGKRGVGH